MKIPLVRFRIHRLDRPRSEHHLQDKATPNPLLTIDLSCSYLYWKTLLFFLSVYLYVSFSFTSLSLTYLSLYPSLLLFLSMVLKGKPVPLYRVSTCSIIELKTEINHQPQDFLLTKWILYHKHCRHNIPSCVQPKRLPIIRHIPKILEDVNTLIFICSKNLGSNFSENAFYSFSPSWNLISPSDVNFYSMYVSNLLFGAYI